VICPVIVLCVRGLRSVVDMAMGLVLPTIEDCALSFWCICLAFASGEAFWVVWEGSSTLFLVSELKVALRPVGKVVTSPIVTLRRGVGSETTRASLEVFKPDTSARMCAKGPS